MQDVRGGKIPLGVGKPVGLPCLMDDHHHDRTLTILYATESGGAQDAANKVARHCRELNFGCRNINIRDYHLVRVFLSPTLLGEVRKNPAAYQITECSVRPHPRNSHNIRRFNDGFRTRTKNDDHALEYASSVGPTERFPR